VKKLRFHRAARPEYLDAVDWYGARSEEAALGFAELVEACLHEIPELPLAWPAWPMRNDIRVRTLQRYPYSIIYHLGDEIVILAVAHQKRRPGYWLKRAPR
jgi:plasmid stabilization system protein ParE